MARRFFLHVGPAKTGTSAVQHVLSNHDGSVVLYPKVGLWGDGSHHNLVLNFFGDYRRPEIVREDPAQLLARIGEAATLSDRDLVISSETLFGHRRIGEFVAATLGHLPAIRVEIIAVVREHFERAASIYNQRVKDAVTGERRDPDQFLQEHAAKLCYAEGLRRFRRAGFDLTVINYHPADTVVERLLAHLGFASDKIEQASPRNISLSRKVLVATLAANRAGGTTEERDALVSALRRTAKPFAPSRPIFGSDAAARAEPIFAADRRFLKRQFGIELPDARALFAADAFAIDELEFAELSALTQEFGDYGRAVQTELRLYSHSKETSRS